MHLRLKSYGSQVLAKTIWCHDSIALTYYNLPSSRGGTLPQEQVLSGCNICHSCAHQTSVSFSFSCCSKSFLFLRVLGVDNDLCFIQQWHVGWWLLDFFPGLSGTLRAQDLALFESGVVCLTDYSARCCLHLCFYLLPLEFVHADLRTFSLLCTKTRQNKIDDVKSCCAAAM
ncbi:TPA: hypothetical protein ACH3X1_009312 [Trebouxia sp. C0004]